jgi:thiol-disulfide isomerase/thioredoxin
MLWITFVAILLSIGFLYFYLYYYIPTSNNAKYKNISNGAGGETYAYGSGKTATVYFFTVDWCPYCKKAAPEWNNFMSNYNGTLKNGYIIECVTENCTNDKDPAIMEIVKKYKIEGYPTVKMTKDGKVIDLDAKVTTTSLSQFVDNMIK